MRDKRVVILLAWASLGGGNLTLLNLAKTLKASGVCVSVEYLFRTTSFPLLVGAASEKSLCLTKGSFFSFLFRHKGDLIIFSEGLLAIPLIFRRNHSIRYVQGDDRAIYKKKNMIGRLAVILLKQIDPMWVSRCFFNAPSTQFKFSPNLKHEKWIFPHIDGHTDINHDRSKVVLIGTVQAPDGSKGFDLFREINAHLPGDCESIIFSKAPVSGNTKITEVHCCSRKSFLFHLSRLDVLIITSEHDSFGLPIFEGMKAQIPVIFLKHDAIKDLLNDSALAGYSFLNPEIVNSELLRLRDPDYKKKLLYAQDLAVRKIDISRNSQVRRLLGFLCI